MPSWKTKQPNNGSILITDEVTTAGVKGTTPAAGSILITEAQVNSFAGKKGVDKFFGFGAEFGCGD